MIDVDCSKGTYIRTLCGDIGRKMNCPATMSFLVRTRAGAFKLADAYTAEEVTASPASVLLKTDKAVLHLAAIILDADKRLEFIQGKTIVMGQAVPDGLLRIYDTAQELLGIGKAITESQIRPLKVLMQHSD